MDLKRQRIMEVKQNKENIKIEQKKITEKKEKDIQRSIDSLKIGDRVKIKDSNSIGTIEKIKGKSVTINYGQFTAKVSIFDVYKV